MNASNIKKGFREDMGLISDILDILSSAISSISPENLVQRSVRLKENTLMVGEREFDLSRYRKIYIIGAGKASLGMAVGIERILKDRIKEGMCAVSQKYKESKRIEFVESSHPIPDRRGIKSATKALSIARKADKDDLLICLFSGGGSSLFVLPPPGIPLKDIARTVSLLLRSGANIKEINTIRRHISRIKGGRLAKEAYPATVISLLLSDVVGDDISTIASGPTVPDKTTYKDCLGILEKYKLMVPYKVLEYLKAGDRGEVSESPESLSNVYNFVIGNNLLALKTAKSRAEGLGYDAIIHSSRIEGEARDVARTLSEIARGVILSGNPLRPPACIISGGETTVRVKGKGKGGRNQELALAFAVYLGGVKGVQFLSVATDGIDGPTDASGALVDEDTIQKAMSLGISPLESLISNDSYNFHDRVGTILRTGPTNTNVGDIQVILCRPTSSSNLI